MKSKILTTKFSRITVFANVILINIKIWPPCTTFPFKLKNTQSVL